MEKEKNSNFTVRRPDCVTETRMGNTILVVSGFFKEDAVSTAAGSALHSFQGYVSGCLWSLTPPAAHLRVTASDKGQ